MVWIEREEPESCLKAFLLLDVLVLKSAEGGTWLKVPYSQNPGSVLPGPVCKIIEAERFIGWHIRQKRGELFQTVLLEDDIAVEEVLSIRRV